MTGNAPQAIGTLEPAGQAWRLRFTRELAHPVDLVWRALTETEHLNAWFPMRVRGAWAEGATLTFADPQGRGPEFTGRVLACRPPSLLEFGWGPGVLRIELRAHGDDTTLTLLDTLGELGTATRDAAGWHVCLDLLAVHLDGRGTAVKWTEVHPGYVAAFGPEASSIGPPPGYEPAG